MRSKEDAQDYRYFPDPDLVPLEFDENWLQEIKRALPPLPDEVKAKLISQYELSDYDATVLTANRPMAEFSLITLSLSNNYKIACNWLMSDFLALIQEKNVTCEHSKITPQMLAELVNEIIAGRVSGKVGKQVLISMWDSGKNPLQIIKEEGLEQINDDDAISKLVDQVIESHTEQADEYRSGKVRIIGFLVGKVMQLSKGKANPKQVSGMLEDKLSQ